MLTAAAAADLLKLERHREDLYLLCAPSILAWPQQGWQICDKVSILYVGYTSVKKQILKAAREENSNEDPH